MSPFRTRTIVLAAAAALALAGCGGASPGDDARLAPPATAPAMAGPASPTPDVPAQVDAGALAHKLADAGAGVTGVTVQDAVTDPNHLLGRPGGYTSRASFVLACANSDSDPGSVDAGGALEVFADDAGAARRKGFIGALAQEAPELATEYGYQHGPVLLRVTAACPPATAAAIDAALARITG